MVKKIEKLDGNDVVYTSDPNFLGLSKTFKMADLLSHLQSILQEKSRNAYSICYETGYSCQVLQESGGGWRKGQIRISFEFITEVEEITSLQESKNIEMEDSSILDEIRQLQS